MWWLKGRPLAGAWILYQCVWTSVEAARLNLRSPDRCVVGDDWWYYGDRCQSRGSISDKTTLALATSLSVLGAMLVITVISVICVKRKYRKKSKSTNIDLGAQRL